MKLNDSLIKSRDCLRANHDDDSHLLSLKCFPHRDIWTKFKLQGNQKKKKHDFLKNGLFLSGKKLLKHYQIVLQLYPLMSCANESNTWISSPCNTYGSKLQEISLAKCVAGLIKPPIIWKIVWRVL